MQAAFSMITVLLSISAYLVQTCADEIIHHHRNLRGHTASLQAIRQLLITLHQCT